MQMIVLQEAKIPKDELDDIAYQFDWYGWTYHGVPCVGKANGRSGGLALITRRGIMATQLTEANAHCKIPCGARAAAWLVEGLVAGGFVLANVHLVDIVGPWHPENPDHPGQG